MRKCEMIGCQAFVSSAEMFCLHHSGVTETSPTTSEHEAMHLKYPKYYKDVSTLQHIDVYAVHRLFAIDDPSGALQHASKTSVKYILLKNGKLKWVINAL